MVCLGNICINTLHKGAEDDDDDDDNNDNNNNNNNITCSTNCKYRTAATLRTGEIRAFSSI
jgi:hypothetical protein